MALSATISKVGRAVFGIARDSDTRADTRAQPFQIERLIDGVDDFIRQHLHMFTFMGIIQQNREFIATEARQRVACAKHISAVCISSKSPMW